MLDQPRARWRGGAFGQQPQGRLWAIGLAIVVELLIIGLLFLVGSRIAGNGKDAPQDSRLEAVTFALPEEAEDTPPDQPAEPETAAPPETRPETPPVPQPPSETPLPTPLRPPPLIIANPAPAPLPPAAAVPPPPATTPAPQTAPPQRRNYGPVDSGPQGQPDSQQVGTAPNGEPLFAARWYREPTRQELSGYLSTATAPSAALIACRTVPDFRVEDCQLISESPAGSDIGRAVLAATWQFRVRPARVGGRTQVGSWVRIRIDYTVTVVR